MTRILTTAALTALALTPLATAAQSSPVILGTWRTPTGSVVQAAPCGSAVCLSIAQVEKSAPTTLDGNNPDRKLRTRSLCGLEIGKDFKLSPNGKSAEGGTLYDPESGKTYSGSIETAGPDALKLRGYIGVKLFGRTETWKRTAAPTTCH